MDKVEMLVVEMEEEDVGQCNRAIIDNGDQRHPGMMVYTMVLTVFAEGRVLKILNPITTLGLAIASPAAEAQVVVKMYDKGGLEVAVVAVVIAEADRTNLHTVVDEGRDTSTGTVTREIGRRITASIVIQEKVTKIVVERTQMKTITTDVTVESKKNVIDNSDVCIK